jgi:hypothetical protein
MFRTQVKGELIGYVREVCCAAVYHNNGKLSPITGKPGLYRDVETKSTYRLCDRNGDPLEIHPND